MKNNLKKYVVLSLLIAVMLASVPKIDASAAGMSSGSVEKLLTKEVKEMLEDFELGEAEQEYLEELKEKFDAGELDSEKEILNEITSAEEKFGFSLSESQKKKIVSLGLKVQDMGLNSEKLTEMAEDMMDKYGDQLKEETETILQEKLVEPAKEAVKEGAKSAVKNFFGEMKRSITGFLGKFKK